MTRSTPSSTSCCARTPGRPSIMTEVPRFAEHAGGARIFLKREDLNHTGSHKINNVLGQALLTKKLGKTRVIAETGAGQHGVATATAAALFGFECTIYMGEVDTERQALNVARMRLLGAEVIPVTTGSRTLKDAINDAYRDWVASVETTNYIFGTAAGPHPFPAMVRDFQKIIGEEARAQLLDELGRLPDAVVACVGGGSNAIGMFDAFLDDADVQALRRGGRRRRRRHGAARGIDRTRPRRRAARRPHLRAAGRGRPDRRVALDLRRPRLPGRRSRARVARGDRARGVHPGDRRRGDAGAAPAVRTEGIIPAIESAHALAGALRLGRELGPDAILAVCLSGRGDKDMDTAARYFDLYDEGVDAVGAARRGRRQGRGDEAVSSASPRRSPPPTPKAAARFVGYLPVGFPDLQTSIEAAVALAENGADILELGPPYCDPVMDGAVIQEATQTALAGGFRAARHVHRRPRDHRAASTCPCSS